MNYCDENSTPRDRISAELFFSEYGTEMRTSGTGCGCANSARTAQTRTTGSGGTNSARTAGTHTTRCGCGCTNTARAAQARTTTTGCGCSNNNGSAQTRSTSVRNVSDSGCPDRRISAPSLAMAYVPMQQWRDILGSDDALANGTLFGELVLPFYPTPCNNEGCQRRRSI